MPRIPPAVKPFRDKVAAKEVAPTKSTLLGVFVVCPPPVGRGRRRASILSFTSIKQLRENRCPLELIPPPDLR